MKSKPTHFVKLPTQLDVEDQLVLTLNLCGRPAKPVDLYQPLADHFKLSPLQRSAFLQNIEESAWHDRVRQARRHLFNQGFVSNTRRGFWSLTSKGRERAKHIEMLRKLTLDDL